MYDNLNVLNRKECVMSKKMNMLLLIGGLILLILNFSLLNAAEVELLWQANSETDLGGYKIHYGTISKSYDVKIDVAKKITYTVNDLEENMLYFFALTAYDTLGNESSFSNEVSIEISSVNAPVGDVSNNYIITDLNIDKEYYIDRQYIITSIPEELEGSMMIKTANKDRDNDSNKFFSFYLNEDAKIYIGYDSRATNVPHWLQNYFRRTDIIVHVTEYTQELILWERDCSKAQVSLGGNFAAGAENVESMYVVFIQFNATSTSIADNGLNTSNIPDAFMLQQNYPNPFNAGTEIQFQLPAYSYVNVTIYNVIGQEVCTLINDFKDAGSHLIHWNGADNFGVTLPSGLYVCQLTVYQDMALADNNGGNMIYSEVKKMNMLK